MRLRALLSILAIFGACSCGEDPPATGLPVIFAFDVTPMSVASGTPVSVSWRVGDATEVTITADGLGTIVDRTDALNGSITTAPLTARTTFTLTARNAIGANGAMKVVEVGGNPNDVRIELFGPDTLTVAPGGDVHLMWRVVNATSMRIDPNVLTTTDMFEGQTTVNPVATTTYTLTAEGPGGPATASVVVTVEGTPVINSFTATPQMLELGESSVLAWSVAGASGITVTDSAGAGLYAGTEGDASVMVMPSQNETYTLTARGSSGAMVTRDVTITVNRVARIVSFTASPDTINSGQTSQLAWVVERATAVEIQVMGVTVNSTTALSGSYAVTPATTTDYTLVARNPEGDSTAVVTVTVNNTTPAVVQFDASPNPAQIGTRTTITWNAVGATSVRITGPAGAIAYDGTSPTGTALVSVTATTATWNLAATNANGTTNATLVITGVAAPVISSFTATPPTFTGMSAMVTLDWASDGAATRLEIDGVADPAFPGTASGTYAVNVTQTTSFVLFADNAVASTRATVRVVKLTSEVEPNNTAGSALPLMSGDGAIGSIFPAGDLDYYSVVVPPNGNVRVEISDGNGGCAFDSAVSLFAPDGVTLLGTDDDDGFDLCSLIDPTVDAFAASLTGGTYYIAVAGVGGAQGTYTVVVVASPAACGNRILERGPGEQCEDGNTTAGDGCDPTCQLETVAVINGPGGSGIFTGSHDFVGRVDWYRVEMSADGYIFAETFIPVVGRCDNSSGGTSSDVRVTLWNSAFAVLGDDDDDGIGSCARIDPRFDSFAAVNAGTYWISVEEDFGDATLGAYTIDIRTSARPECGNNILDGSEQCDDGNTLANDGCDSACALEGILESEPNNNSGTADPLTGTSVVVSGAINPAGDFDFYSLVVPDGWHLDAYITVNSFDACPANPTGRLTLVGTNGTTILATNATGGYEGNCGRIWPYTSDAARAMVGGTYFIRVNELGDNSTIAQYYLHVRVIAPGCGNSVLEGAEVCEDGNLTDGDGCSAMCGLEASQVITLPNATSIGVAGAIAPSFVRNTVQLQVTADTQLHAETFAPVASAGTCPAPAATTLRLWAADGTTELGSDSTDGINSCSQISPVIDDFTLLTPGTYYLTVEETGFDRELSSYELVVTGRASNSCGNYLREGAESCDDGNFATGDGCDASCQIEPLGVLAGPPGAMVFGGQILPIGDHDYYRLDLAAASIIYARTGIPAIGTCSGGDTVLRLYDAMFTELAVNDDSSFLTQCSLIDGVSNTPAARVPAGTYYIRVEDFGDDGTIGAYEVDIRITAQNLCGNGIQESANIESCDDGNTVDGDGCDATCALEENFTFVATAGTNQSISSTLNTTEIEVVRIEVAATVYLSAETFVPVASACIAGRDPIMHLLTAGGVEVAADDDDGVNACALINRARDPGARLTPGVYFLTIEEDGRDQNIGPYQIVLAASTPDVCGDSILEPATGEGCDDGNTTPGDGCDAVCAMEIAATYTIPGPAVAFSGNLMTATSLQHVQLDVTAPAYLRAEVNAPAWPECTGGIDSFMRLYDAAMVEVGSDDSDGRNACSMFNPDSDGFAVLAAGTYYVSIEEDGRNATLGNYQLRVLSAPVNVCGNGYREAGEQCDDGNTTSADGCSATCQIDITVDEVEPNNTIALATPLGLSGVGIRTATGLVSPIADFDFFSFTVPPGPSLTMRARTYATAGDPLSVCPGTIDTRLQLQDGMSAGALEDNDDQGGTNNCSLIDGTLPDLDPNARLAPGTYYLRVTHFNHTAVAGPYFLEVKLEP